MFDKIMKAIKKVVVAGEGLTDYLDCMPFSAPVRSGPNARRQFFSIPMQVTVVKVLRGKVMEKDKGKVMLTFFQRYSDDATYWTEVASHACAMGGNGVFTGGGWREETEKWLEPVLLKVLKGETVTIDVPTESHGWEKYTVTAKLLKGKDIPVKMKVPEYMKPQPKAAAQ